MTREEVIELIRKSVEGNRLTCDTAHQLSEKYNIPLRDIGEICNDLKIRISACMLGCF